MIRCLIIAIAVAVLWALPALAIDFDHATHPSPTCSTCHIDTAQSITPEPSLCLGCHEEAFLDTVTFTGIKTHGPTWSLNHRAAAKSATNNCAACHQQQECLECHAAGRADEMGSFDNSMTNVHRSDFQVTHPIAARTNPQLCTSCHEENSCADCHNRFSPTDLAIESHRRSWSSINVTAVDHGGFSADTCATCHPNGSVAQSHDWQRDHAREARKNLATCQACHPQGEICLTCHSATSGLRSNPHPKGWDKTSGRLNRASDGKTCRKCH
ncbi:MAG: cytochrome C [Desulfuromonas sp.]|nr:MAG: cytochrome C [Desulfuromonas sp.]